MGSEPQHAGNCCESCLQDEEFDPAYSMWPYCCCRSELFERKAPGGE